MHEVMTNYQIIKGSREEVAKNLESITKSSDIWAVGDVVCSTLTRYGPRPRVCIFDRRTLRKICYVSIDLSQFSQVIDIYNPRGTISEDALRTLRNVSSTKITVAIRVIGEEDLLSLAVLVVGDEGSYLVYGLPSVGVVLIPINRYNKERANQLLTQFLIEPIDVHGKRSK